MSDKISDYRATIAKSERHTFVLAGDTGTGGSMKPLTLYDIRHTPAAVDKTAWTVFNGLVNGGNARLRVGTYDAGTKTLTAIVNAVACGEAKSAEQDASSAIMGIERADTKVVLATSSGAIDAKEGSHFSIFAAETNEFAEKGSNNLPWIITCNDDSLASVDGASVIADCDTVQGPQLGVKLPLRPEAQHVPRGPRRRGIPSRRP